MATKVIALHTVQRTLKAGVAATRDTPAVPPQTESLKPGTIFVVDDDKGPNSELAFLLEAKAVSIDVPKSAPAATTRVVDGPGVPVVKEDDSPMTDTERAEWVERGKKVNVNVGDNWKPATIRKKVTEGEAASAAQAAKDSNAGGGDTSNLV